MQFKDRSRFNKYEETSLEQPKTLHCSPRFNFYGTDQSREASK